MGTIDTFRRVLRISGINVLTFEKDTAGGSACNTGIPLTPQPGSPYIRIKCGITNILTEYTVVHELGHAFTSQTGGTLTNSTINGL